MLFNYTDFGIEKLLDGRVVPTQMITSDTQVFIFMPWVFLLFITIGGKIAGTQGYLGMMVLTIAFYFSRIDILGLTLKIVFNQEVI